MKKVNDLFGNVSLGQAVDMRRNEYHEARFEYELSLRRFLNDYVRNCPCCFKGFYKDTEETLTEQLIKEGVKPDDLEVLEEMRSRRDATYPQGENADGEIIN